MTLRTYARGLVAGAATVMALAGGTGVAHADPEPTPPPLPPVIDQWMQSVAHAYPEPTPPPLPPVIDQWMQIPQTFVNPSNQRQPVKNSDDVGMICENLLVACG